MQSVHLHLSPNLSPPIMHKDIKIKSCVKIFHFKAFISYISAKIVRSGVFLAKIFHLISIEAGKGEGSRFSYIPIFSSLAPKLWPYLKWGRFYPLRPSPWGEGMELIFLNLFHMRDTHNDFQLPSSKTEIVVKWGQFNPPWDPSWGGWGAGSKFLRSTTYERHTYQFSASYLQDLYYL